MDQSFDNLNQQESPRGQRRNRISTLNQRGEEALNLRRELGLSLRHNCPCSMLKLKLDCDITIERTPQNDYYQTYTLFNNRGGLILQDYSDYSYAILDSERKKGYYKNIFGVTMYDQGKQELERSLLGILRNQPDYFQNTQIHQIYNILIIIADGKKKIQEKPDLVKFLESFGLYSSEYLSEWEKLDKLSDEAKDQTDYCYTFESRLYLQDEKILMETEPGTKFALDVLFVLKPNNKKKLHSHL